MRLALLSAGDGWHLRDLQRAAAQLQHEAVAVDFRRLGAGVNAGVSPLADCDGVLVRTMPPGSLEQVVFRMDVLQRLQARGVAVLNPPAAIETCVDKYLASARLEAAGLRVPPTIVCQHAEAALEAFATLGGDVVVKPLFGSEGRGMVRVSDPDLAWRTFRTLERLQSVLYLQQFIPHPGWDLRVFAIGGRVLTGMRRHANGDWRTNVAQGGTAEAVAVPPGPAELALRAAAAVGAPLAGVDLLPGPDGWYIIEVNAVPGWRALAPVTGVDVAAALVQFLTGPYPREVTIMLSVGCRAHVACILEATARKPGNVHRFQDFDDSTYLDFLLSAAALAPILDAAPDRPVGATVLAGVEATRCVVKSNTNLGILLLLAPLAAVPEGEDLRAGVERVLAVLDVEDARAVYQAIRLAAPAGLGRVAEQDVHDEPTQTLRQVMALAAERDLVARQYANGFQEVFATGVPALCQPLERGEPLESAIIGCQLHLLASYPDSLIARKRGLPEAEEVRTRAGLVLSAGWPSWPEGQVALHQLDAWLRADGHGRNPGTTADLVTACLFVALRQGSIPLPLCSPWAGGSANWRGCPSESLSR